MFLVDTMTIPLLYMSYSVRVSKLVTYHLYLKRPREANSSFNSAAISLQLAPGLISSSPLLCTSTLASQYCNIYNIKILEVCNISVSRLLNSCLFHIRSSHWLNQKTRVPPVQSKLLTTPIELSSQSCIAPSVMHHQYACRTQSSLEQCNSLGSLENS